MFCFKNGNTECMCQVCAMRSTGMGNDISYKIPNIDIYKETLTISFGKKLLRKISQNILEGFRKECYHLILRK